MKLWTVLILLFAGSDGFSGNLQVCKEFSSKLPGYIPYVVLADIVGTVENITDLEITAPNSGAQVLSSVGRLTKKLKNYFNGRSDSELHKLMEEWTAAEIKSRGHLPGLMGTASEPKTVEELEALVDKDPTEVNYSYATISASFIGNIRTLRFSASYDPEHIPYLVGILENIFDQLLFHEYIGRLLQQRHPPPSNLLVKTHDRVDREWKQTFPLIIP